MKHKNERATFRLQITHGDDGIAPRPWRRPLACLQIALFFFLEHNDDAKEIERAY